MTADPASASRPPLGWRGYALAGLAMVVDLVFWGGGTGTRFGGELPPVVVYVAAVLLWVGLGQAPRRPTAVFWCAWAYSLAGGLVLPTFEPFAALLLATYFITRFLPLAVARWYLLATAAPWAVNTVNAVALSHPDPVGIVVIAAIWCLITALVWMAGVFAFRTAELARARMEVHAAELTATVQAERVRMARELHDIVAHSVSAIVLQSAGAQHAMRTPDPVVGGALRTIEATSTQAMRELRRLLGVLVDDSGQPTVGYARLSELDHLIAATRACAIEVSIRHSGEPHALPPAFEHAVYRTVQEALANVMRHAGPGSSADVAFGWRADRVEVTVQSEARGDHSPVDGSVGSGLGLPGLAQRLRDLGGECTWRRVGESGFVVTAWLPLSAPDGQSTSPAAIDPTRQPDVTSSP